MSNAIPTGWSTQRLGEVVSKFQNGNAFSSSGYVEDGIPIISMGCLGLNGQFKKEYLKQKCWSRSERASLERYIVQPFDLLMAMTDVTPTMELIGRSCIAKIEQEALLNQRVGLLRIDEEKACKYFISYVTNFDDWRSYAKGSSGLGAQANLGTQQILDGSVLFPPLPEQQKIAAILTSVDDVIESTQAQINKLRDLKAGMMQELLTKGIGHTEFNDSPVGRIPKAWDIRKLSDVITQFQNGYAFNSGGYVIDGIPIISMGCLGLDGRFIKKYAKQKCWSAIERQSLERYIVKPNDLLMAMTDVTPTMDLIGRACIADIDSEALLNQRVGLIRVDDSKICKYYLSYITNFNHWRSYAKGSSGLGAQANLGTQQILDGKVLLPPIQEQKAIANALLSIDASIDTIEVKKNAISLLKKALMQDLLTGKVRVKVN